MSSDDANLPNYDYKVSTAAPLAFAAIYGVCLLIHLTQAFYHRTPWIWAFLIGVMLEVLGFITRYISIKQLYTLWPIIVSQVALIVAPAFLAAGCYSCSGRLMSYLGGQYSPMNHHFITKIFVVADFFSIFSQAIGGSLLSSTDPNTLRAGFNILIAALAFQVLMFSGFIVVTVMFDIRSRRGLGEQRKAVQPIFNVLYLSSAMIVIRSIYRLIEFASVKFTPTGASGYTLNHEWLLYVWDALPIIIAVLTISVAHPGRYLPQKKGERIDGTFEEPQPSRVCGCCCIYKRPRPIKYDATGMPMHKFNSSTVPIVSQPQYNV
ncbi:RTA1 like protein-domain-containing protein [Auriculariales sp. MPI-PUGE-AT-0066]|nr:RTA1 like protein-domain-containing protein [Auriculariales sp. MPI-PUGE-AT-0066]